MTRRAMPRQKPNRSKQDYATPDNFIAAVKHRLGIHRFVFDFAANKSNAKADGYWWARDDALDPRRIWSDVCYPFTGWAWLNPPFQNIEPWAKRCVGLMRSDGRVAFLVPASVGSDWFRDHVDGKARVLFLNGRLAFIKGKPRDLYPKDCILCLYGPDITPGRQDHRAHNRREGLMPKDPKTADQLRREIAYYADQLKQTRSSDRRRRAHAAIRVREQQLVKAQRREFAGQ